MKTTLLALTALVLTACAGHGPERSAGDSQIAFKFEQTDDHLVIECRPLSMDVGWEWIDECDRVAGINLAEARARGLNFEMPDRPFGMAAEAMRSNWEWLSAGASGLTLSREIELQQTF